MELFRVTLAVVFRKHPGSAVSLRGEVKASLVFGITDFHDVTDGKHSVGISYTLERKKSDL